ncbi:MAG TPA: hypothetical protein VHC90_21805 [Bryobacteraceae bacterium]|nr:hypothetical protein [Bryobacteraceae bacterium]
MKRLALILAFAGLLAGKNPPSGKASDASVQISATFLDPAATKEATGSDFDKAFTVIQVTVTPLGGKALTVQPDDFLLRVNSNSDSSGPLTASQVYGAGGGLVLHTATATIGIDPTNMGNTGVTPSTQVSHVDPATIKALQAKLLQSGKTTSAVTGLLFFPISKKGHRDLDLVYSSPTSKVHVDFR